jgi:hypothetical protein
MQKIVKVGKALANQAYCQPHALLGLTRGLTCNTCTASLQVQSDQASIRNGVWE